MLDLSPALEEVARCLDAPQTGTNSPSVLDSIRQLATSILAYKENESSRLTLDLQVALQEACRRADRVSIAVTGLGWLGSGVPSVEQEMIALVQSARRDISLCAYAVSRGALRFLRQIQEVVQQGVRVQLLVNEFAAQPADVQRYLVEAAAAFPARWNLRDFRPATQHSDLHAKVLVVDRSTALVGSANLSFHGMTANHEMALIVRGPTAELIAERIDMLASSASARPVL